MSVQYNKVYETLVSDEFDLEGLIAYGLYKLEKRKQIIDIKSKTGQNPTTKEMELIESLLTNHLEFYQQKSNELLNATIEYFVENEKEVLYERYFKKYESKIFDDKLNTIVENTKKEILTDKITTITNNTKPKTLWGELKIELLGNLAWVILLILFSVITYYNSGGVRRLQSKIIEIVQEPEIDSTKTIESLKK